MVNHFYDTETRRTRCGEHEGETAFHVSSNDRVSCPSCERSLSPDEQAVQWYGRTNVTVVPDEQFDRLMSDADDEPSEALRAAARRHRESPRFTHVGLAERWHALSDHAADGTDFGGGLCNCLQQAERVETLMAQERTRIATAIRYRRDEHADRESIDSAWDAYELAARVALGQA